MSLYNIPIMMAYQLGLMKKVSQKQQRLLEIDGELEDVEIKTSSENGYMIDIIFKFKIKNITYTVSNYYNSSSPYALLMCELYDYNERDEMTEYSETSETDEHDI